MHSSTRAEQRGRGSLSEMGMLLPLEGGDKVSRRMNRRGESGETNGEKVKIG